MGFDTIEINLVGFLGAIYRAIIHLIWRQVMWLDSYFSSSHLEVASNMRSIGDDRVIGWKNVLYVFGLEIGR